MMLNSGSRLTLVIFIIVLVALILFMVLFAVNSKKNKKTPVVLKVFILVFAIVSIAGSFVVPLSYYSDIPINIQYGKFYSVKSDRPNEYINIHRDSLSFHASGSSNELQGNYILKDDILDITYKDGTKAKFFVKHFGKELVNAENNQRAFLYGGD